jgi:hypothetical protein
MRAIRVYADPGDDQLVRSAADELARYMESIFEVEATRDEDPDAGAEARFFVGSPDFLCGLAPVRETLRDAELGEQTIAVRPVKAAAIPSMVVSGGSPRAVLWAVYELVRRCGAVYLLTGDVLPPRRPFAMPEVDIVRSPSDAIRAWAFPFGLMFGPESWPLSEYRSLLDQLAKLGFNRIAMQFYPSFPHLSLRLGGIDRTTSGLFFDLHVPIGDDMVGRELFDDRRIFWNPDLPLDAPIGDTLAAGERFVHGVIAHAHARGMEFLIGCLPLEYTMEFAPLLSDPLLVTLLGTRTVVPGPATDIDDPVVMDLALEVFRVTVDTYPEADAVGIVMPEFREWVSHAERAWVALDARYGLGGAGAYAEVLAAAGRRSSYPGGADRAVQETKGDIVALYFYDRFFNDLKARGRTARPDVRIVYQYLAEELYPHLPRIIPPDVETVEYVDYTPLRVLHRGRIVRPAPPMLFPRGRPIP